MKIDRKIPSLILLMALLIPLSGCMSPMGERSSGSRIGKELEDGVVRVIRRATLADEEKKGQEGTVIVNPDGTETGTTGKTESEKDTVVLMPLRTKGIEKSYFMSMESALAEGLSAGYTVYSGDRVTEKVKEIFAKVTEETAANEEWTIRNVSRMSR